jgi:hypothetical protein
VVFSLYAGDDVVRRLGAPALDGAADDVQCVSLGVFYFGRASAYSTPASRAVGSTVGLGPKARVNNA